VKKKRRRFPIKVKRGSSVVKIYRDRKREGTYYRVAYSLGGKRHRLNFRDLESATSEAEAKASQLSRGDMDAVQLSGRDRLEYGRAKDAVKDFALPLDAVAIEYNEARELLDGIPLLDAARFYARHHGKGIKYKSVALAVDEMIATKDRKGVSEVYLADLRYRLGVFKESFHCDVNQIAQMMWRCSLTGCGSLPVATTISRSRSGRSFDLRKGTAGYRKTLIFWNAWKGGAKSERPLKSSRHLNLLRYLATLHL
jgi:hypothetical protein